jgi:beta-lactamase superfamily II metal-dependent hydrolase
MRNAGRRRPRSRSVSGPVRATAVTAASSLAALVALLGGNACVDLSEPEVRVPQQNTAPPTDGFRCGAPPSADDDALVIHFIDVGQGDAIWIETPDDGENGNGTMEGLNILVDVGKPAFDREGAPSPVIEYLTAHGHPPGARIDYLLVTHAHADHYGGATEVMDAYDVVNVGDPGFDNDENTTWAQFVTAAGAETAANGGRLLRPFAETFVDAELAFSDAWGSELELRVLNAEPLLRQGDTRSRQIDNTSIVLQLTYEGRSVLLMGDAGVETESDILAAVPDLTAEVLKVGHHGSTSSTSPAFIAQVFSGVPETRRVAVISSGLTSFNGVQLPAASTVTRVLEFVSASAFFSTEHDDAEDGQSESSAAGDDDVTVVISADGSITACYAE